MNKHLIVLGIVVLLICVGLSGCTEQQATKKSSGNYQDTKNYWLLIEQEYLGAIRDIGREFKNVEDIYNYNESQLENHKEIVNSYDISGLDEYGSYAGNYYSVRSDLIKGLEFIIREDWENSWKNILYADNELFDINTFTGDMWNIHVGLGHLESMLYDLKKD